MPNPQPKKFFLKAQYGAGESNKASWTISINKKTLEKTLNGKKLEKLEISEKQFLDLLEIIKTQDFFSLKPNYSSKPETEDLPTSILEINLLGKKHKVRVYGISYSSDLEVQRFKKIFSAIEALV